MKESEFKIIIKIDPEKTEKYGYDYQEVIEAVEEVCDNCKCINKGNGVFTGRGLDSDLGLVHKACSILCSRPWFQKCVKSFEWFAPDNEYYNVLDFYAKRRGTVFG